MKILSLETSTSSPVIAFFEKDQLLFKALLNSSKKHSHSLMQTILQELNNHGYSLQDVAAIAVGLGPGSFLGTRSGVVTAKALAYGLDIDIIGFCSLSLYCPDKEGPFYVLSDAKSKGVYILKGEKTSKTTVFEKNPQLFSLKDFLSFYKNEPLISADESLFSKDSFFLDKLQVVEVDFFTHIKEIFHRLEKKKTLSNSPEKLDIHYLRLS